MIRFVISLLVFSNFLLGFSQRAQLYKGLPEITYYENGNVRVARNFKAGKFLGYKTFYRNGALQSNYVFNSKGYHDSIANFYYPNGKVKTVWKYKNDIVKKRIDYTLEGEVVKGNKDYQKIKLCNANLPYGKNYLSWTFRRAKLNSKLGFYDQALEDFDYIFSEINPALLKQFAERSIYHTMAINYTYIEDYEKALIYNFKALDIEPNNQSVLNNMGWLLVKAKDYDLALKYLDKCHEINPINYYAFFNKAILYLETGNYTKALSFIDKAIADQRSHKLSKKAMPNEKTIWTTRGEIYYKLGRYDEGIKDLLKALEENPANSHAYKCLALIYKDTNQINKACEALEKAKVYKHDKIYNTNEVKVLIDSNCISK